MEKVVITAEGDSLDSPLDSHFGRCKYLLICNPESKQVDKAIANGNAEVQGGAGVSTAQMVADLDIKNIVTGNIGPKAFEALNASGIKIFVAQSGSVGNALNAFVDNKLEEVTDASAQMHSGLGAKKE